MKFIRKRRITESNIQAEFYHLCKLNGINCYLEYKHESCRFDAIVFDNEDEILFIVEFKSKLSIKGAREDTVQLRRYQKYRTPIILISNIEEVKPSILIIKRKIQSLCQI